MAFPRHWDRVVPYGYSIPSILVAAVGEWGGGRYAESVEM